MLMLPFPRSFVQDLHAHVVIETLQSIRAADMTPLLQRLYQGPGGVEMLDVLMKYLYVLSLATCISSSHTVIFKTPQNPHL